MTTGASPVCLWCGKAFTPRRGGGSQQTFCHADCRHRFHGSARQWAERAVAAGILTVADLRNGNPEACTLVGEGKLPSPMTEEGKAVELLDAILDDLLIDSPPNALDALSTDTLDRIDAYLNEPVP